MQQAALLPKPFLYLLIALSVMVNLSGIFTPFFTDDPALYASVSKELIYRRTFFELFSYGQHWLDKPHFPFWMAYFSFRIFGISDWAYKLPALLFFLLSLFYTYIFARWFYDRVTALVAVIILATAMHTLMSNTDVRAEPYLMALLIGAVYHLARLNERFSWPHLLLSAVFTACAVMTKGLFVIVAIYGAVFGQLLFTGKIREIFQPKWLGMLLLTAIFILPEVYALYIQFDLHPERTVFQRQGVSGIRFFLWDSQFGRFFNSGPIVRSKGSIFFFVHTLLWAFAPWCLIFFYALLKNLGRLIRNIRLNEYYTFCGGVLLLLLFSLSGFQLPFYTDILFPFFAIFTAPLFTGKAGTGFCRFANIGMGVYAGALIVLLLVLQVFFGAERIWFLIALLLVFAVGGWKIFQINASFRARFFAFACLVILGAHCFSLNLLYPTLVKYKGEIAVAKYVNTAGRNKKIYNLSVRRNIFQFYTNREIELWPQENFGQKNTDKRGWYFADEMTMGYLVQQKIPFRLIRSFDNYNSELVKFKFLRPETRAQTLAKLYLIAPVN